MTRFSPAGWARRERRGPRSRGTRPLLLVLGEKRGAREGDAFFLLKGGVRRERKKKKSKSLGPCFPQASATPSLKQSTLCRLGFFFSPRNHERPRSARFPPRRRPRVGEFCSLGLREGRAKARRHAGKRDFILFFRVFSFFLLTTDLFPLALPLTTLLPFNYSAATSASRPPLRRGPSGSLVGCLRSRWGMGSSSPSRRNRRKSSGLFSFLSLFSSFRRRRPHPLLKKKKLVSLSLSLQQETPPRPTSTAPSRATTASTRSASAPTRRSSNGSRTRS